MLAAGQLAIRTRLTISHSADARISCPEARGQKDQPVTTKMEWVRISLYTPTRECDVEEEHYQSKSVVEEQ
jgi:hypothetical protein